jgi:hypothetical protein
MLEIILGWHHYYTQKSGLEMAMTWVFLIIVGSNEISKLKEYKQEGETTIKSNTT